MFYIRVLYFVVEFIFFFFFKQKTAYDMRISDWSSDVCSSDLLLMHGDAAFAGQGLVPETLDLSELKGYRIGGTIHFIVNNQIGFTTNPINSRSGPYCSDVAKIIQAPILHVNGADPEAVTHVARIATEFRTTLHKDVVADISFYRHSVHKQGAK